MKKILFNLWQRRTFEKAYQEALKCSRNGDKNSSFEMFRRLSEERPFDVNTRRQLLLLANELGKEVNLPSENIANTNH